MPKKSLIENKEEKKETKKKTTKKELIEKTEEVGKKEIKKETKEKIKEEKSKTPVEEKKEIKRINEDNIENKKVETKKEEKQQSPVKDVSTEDRKKVYKISEAIKELRKEKRNFVQTVDLIINLKKFDARKTNINTYIQLPNPLDKKIAAFLTTNKLSIGIDIIHKDSFESYKNKRDIKRLEKKYDMFLAHASLMPAIASKFGKVLGQAGKMPTPQLGIITKEDEETIKQLIEKMKKSVKIRTRENSIKIAVAKENMNDEKIEENVKSAIKSIIELLPLKKDNLRNILIKFTMSKPLLIENEN